jgi:hypothetical protein
LSLLEHLAPLAGRLSAVVVSTPQAVALLDAAKCVSFTRTAGLPVLGVVENMSGYVCPCCGEVSAVFSTGGGAELARTEGLPFLGSLPVDTALVELLDAAEPASIAAGDQSEEHQTDVASVGDAVTASFPLLARYQRTPTANLFMPIVNKILGTLPEVEARAVPQQPQSEEQQ